ncbi:MAG: hypothetical protein ACYCOU_00565 [Sulfobacillus sp.]
MGCRTYFRDGALVVPKAGTTLADVEKALQEHFETDANLDNMLENVGLSLCEIGRGVDQASVNIDHLPPNPEHKALFASGEDWGRSGVTDMEDVLKVIAPFVEPDGTSFLEFENDESYYWRYVVRGGKLYEIGGEVVFNGPGTEVE